MVTNTITGRMDATNTTTRKSSLIEVIAWQSSTTFHLQIKLFFKFFFDIYFKPLESTKFKFIPCFSIRLVINELFSRICVEPRNRWHTSSPRRWVCRTKIKITDHSVQEYGLSYKIHDKCRAIRFSSLVCRCS